MESFKAVIPVAGQGKRMQSDINKQFMLLQGMPIIVHTLRIFQAATIINEIVLICGPGEEQYYKQEVLRDYGITKPVTVVTGGKERQDSVYYGLQSISEVNCYVMIHDGVRPLVTLDLISRMAEEVVLTGAVVAGVPVKDTIKRTDAGGYIIDTVQRENLWQIQTPQAFELGLVKQAHERARAEAFYGTDDATLLERQGVGIKIIYGSYENIKITTPEDIVVAETILQGRARR